MIAGTTTTALAEGSNLYFTNSRADARVATGIAATTTTALAEGTNLYYTAARFNTAFAGKSTTDLLEGSNLYFTPNRVASVIAGTTTTALAEGSNLYFTNSRVNDVINASTTIVKSAVPTYGKVLVGNAAGGFTLMATSTLGLSGGGGGSSVWGSFTGTLSDQTDLQAALDAKLSLTNWYATTTTALAEGSNLYFTNSRADTRVAAGIAATTTDALAQGSTNKYYSTNLFATDLAATTTTALAEGSNLYYTAARFNTALAGKSTTDLTEGSNLYFTNNRVASVIAATTTDALAQGSTNKYYSDTLARGAVSSSATGLTYTSGTGIFTLTSGYVIPLTASSTEWATAYANRITSASLPLSITANAISISQASLSTDGYLSSADFNTFNNKFATTSTDYYLSTKSTSNLTEGSNLYFTNSRVASVIAGTTTTALAEGSNLYFTNSRADARVAAGIAATTTTALAEGTNLYFTPNRVASVIAATTTDALAQGSTNKYYSTNLFAADLAATTTTALAEGSNLYFSNSRVQTYIDTLNKGYFFATTSASYFLSQNQGNAFSTTSADTYLASKSTSDLLEGTNLYFTNNRVASVIAATTTDALAQGSTNKYYSTNLFAADLAATTSDAVHEGSTNLYFTNARADARVAVGIAATTTTALAEGSNLYWTNIRFDNRLSATTTLPNLITLANLSTVGTITSGTWSGLFGAVSGANLTNLTAANISAGTAGIDISGNANTVTNGVYTTTFNGLFDSRLLATTTSALAEGTNLYYTDARVNSYIAASSTIPKLFTANTWSSLQTFAGGFVSQASSTVNGDFTATGNTVLGASAGNTLTVNSTISSALVPSSNKVFDLGSPSYYWRNAYLDTLAVNSISAASTTIGGTNSQSFTINAGNATADTQDMQLIFFRGTVVPNAVVAWNSALGAKRFEFNQPIYVSNQSGSTTPPTFSLNGIAGQTGNILQIASSTGTTVFSVGPSGETNIGSTLTVVGGTTLSSATTTSLFSTTASSTNLSAQTASFGSLSVANTITGSISGNAGTVTNGVYTTTFNGLFDNRLSASSSISGITTLSNLTLPYTQVSGLGSLATLSTINNSNWSGTELSVANGGTGATTLTGLLQGNGTGAVTAVGGTAGQLPYYNGTNTLLATSSIFVAPNGAVGVGTTNPQWPFNVVGAGGGLTGTAYVNSAFLQNQTNYRGIETGYDTSGNIGLIAAASDGTPSDIAFWNFNGGWAETVRIKGSNSSVGIGTSNPSYKLDVNGAGHFNSFVDASYFVATSSSATTLLNGHLTVNGNTQLANATSTNFFATTASSTNIFAQNASFGSLSVANTITGSISGNAGTVTNGVYTTTFNGLFDNRLSASSSISGITTLPNLSLPSTQVTGLGSLATLSTINNSNWSGTQLSVGNGGTGLTSIGTGIATWWGTPSSANLAAALTDETGTGAAVFAGSPTLTGTVNGASLLFNASSTIGDGTQSGGLTVNGGATTTGSAYIAGNVGIGLTSPGALLSLQANSGTNYPGNLLLKVASSTGLTTPTLFSVDNTGLINGFNFSLQNGTTTNLFSTTASSTNLYSQAASLGTLTLGNLSSTLLSVSGSNQVSGVTMDSSLQLITASNPPVLRINLGNANTWTAIQTFAAASTTNLSASGSLYTPVTSAVLVADSNNKTTAATTQTCTNQFVRAMSAAYVATCNTVSLTADVTGTLPVANGGTGVTSLGTGIATWWGTPSSANLAAALTDETGSGSAVFSANPTLSGTLTAAAANFSGNVGVGTSTPYAKFTVWGRGTTTGMLSEWVNSASTTVARIFESGASYFLGNVGIGTTTSATKLGVQDPVSTGQLALAYDTADSAILSTNSLGNLIVLPSGNNMFLPNTNLWVCTGGSISSSACPSGTPTGQGNLIVQNKIGVASSTPFSAVAVGAGGAITTTEKSLTDSSTITIDWTQGNQQLVTLGGNRTIAFTNYIPGAALRLVACQDATGSRTLTWPAAVLWNSGTSPTLTTTASKCDVLTFIATSATGTVKILGTSVLNF